MSAVFMRYAVKNGMVPVGYLCICAMAIRSVKSA